MAKGKSSFEVLCDVVSKACEEAEAVQDKSAGFDIEDQIMHDHDLNKRITELCIEHGWTREEFNGRNLEC